MKDTPHKYKNPPQALPAFIDSEASIRLDLQSIVDNQRICLDKIASSFAPNTATFEGVVEAIARDNEAANLRKRIISFYQKISPNPELRKASRESKKIIGDFTNESLMRQDIFDLVDALYQKRHNLGLDAENLRLLERSHENYISNGMGLATESSRHRLREIKTKISSLQNEFKKNLNEEDGCLWLTLEELKGVPDDVVLSLEKGTGDNEGKLRLSFKYPHLIPTLKYAINPETRKRVYIANENKCNQNTELFKETIVLRNEKAKLLGYEHYTSMILVDKMAKNLDTVKGFLDNLRPQLTPIARKELEYLKQLKSQDCQLHGIPNDGNYYMWDHKYYTRLLTETEYQVDELEVSQYLPLEAMVAKMLNIFETVMGLVFVELDNDAKAKLSPTGRAEDIVWHEDNIVFSVWNDESEGDEFIGYLYMDLHPRQHKYTHVCNTNFQPGFTLKDGTRHYPSTALICNFSPSTPEKPSLLKHHEAVNLFHELGHGMHSLASKTRYSKFHGTAVAWDFVEAPSQMLENWCWSPSVLKSISQHWQTKEQMPDALIEKLVSTRRINVAIENLIQIHYSLFDMTCHATESRDEVMAIEPSSLFNGLRVSITSISGLELETKRSDWGHGDAIFEHLMSGYEGVYYAYLYSKVFSTDMFDSVFKKSPMDKIQGRRYRHCVLEHGGSRDEVESLTEFLGREPNSEAFSEAIGLGSHSP